MNIENWEVFTAKRKLRRLNVMWDTWGIPEQKKDIWEKQKKSD